MEQVRHFGFIIKDVQRLWVRLFEQRLPQLGMTFTQSKVLVFLSRNEGMTQAKLAEASDTEPMTLVRVLDRMERDDWMPGNVASVLARNEDGSAVRELDNALLRANKSNMVKLVRFLADIDPEHAAGVIRQLLDSPIDDHAISVCLQLVNDKQDRERVAGFLGAARWHVRMHAASALGRRCGGCPTSTSRGRDCEAMLLFRSTCDPRCRPLR